MRVTLRACLAAALAALLAAACGSSSSSSSSSSATPTAPSTGPGAPNPGACRTFNTAGSFALDGDVACVSLESSNLTVDCSQHAVTDHVQYRVDATNVVLRRCNLPALNIQAVSGFTISQSTIVGRLNIAGSNRVTITGNTISAADGSTASCCVIRVVGGSDNQLVGNVIDGRYHGQCSQCGADDGILLDNEAGDLISGNRIVNVWDEGVEGINAVMTTTIADNTIVNAAFAGIGSYWCTHWESDTITSNVISESPKAINVVYNPQGGGCASPAPSGLFSGNTIANNILRDPVASPQSSSFIGLLVDVVSGPAPGAASGNVLQGNDLGTYGIVLRPATAFNVSGNTCGAAGTVAC